MPKEFDWRQGMEPPEAEAVPIHGAWDTPAGIPVDENGESLIPELRDRSPTHNESVLISGIPITMGSTNVSSIWWHWGQGDTYDPKLFVEFLDGSLYSYNGPEASLEVAAGMIETMSPGRYVWNVLRVLWPVPDSKGTGPGTYTQLVKGNRKGRKPNVVRLYPKGAKVKKWKPGVEPPR